MSRELYQMDQTSSESVKAAVDRVAVTYGRIDVLYMNAGVPTFDQSVLPPCI